MSDLRWLDFITVAVYLAAMVWIGVRYAKRQTSTEAYFVARRSIPSWALGISLFATLISSVTFIGYPGSSYGSNWFNLVPGFWVVIVLALAGSVLIPFYREAVGMSAYEYFGKRFGPSVRMYGSLAFALAHFSKMGFIFYLLALPINSMTGWNVTAVIWVVGLVTIYYTLVGGLEAVIWTDVVQGIILWIGIFICLGYLLFLPPGGPSAVFALASANNKFGLGSWELDFTKPSIVVLSLYGFFWYLQKYAADQTVVQRYLVAKSDRDAFRGSAIGAVLCIPVWTLFMLIGTSVWAFYRLTGEQLPATITKADQVFPYFLTTHIPPGLAGLFIASLLAAAMSTLASDLNCISAVAVEDYYRWFRPKSTDLQRLKVGRISVLICGILAVLTALALVQTKGQALNLWFTVSGIASGGLAGLFLLAFFSTRANRRGIWIGICAAVIFTAWATLTLNGQVLDLGRFNFRMHEYMIGILAHVILLVAGWIASNLFPPESAESGELTIWGWRGKRARPPDPRNAPSQIPAE